MQSRRPTFSAASDTKVIVRLNEELWCARRADDREGDSSERVRQEANSDAFGESTLSPRSSRPPGSHGVERCRLQGYGHLSIGPRAALSGDREGCASISLRAAAPSEWFPRVPLGVRLRHDCHVRTFLAGLLRRWF